MFKVTKVLNVYRFYVTEHVDYYCNGNGCLGCCYSNSEHREEETLEILGVAVCVEYRKIYVYGIEHKLGTYEQRDEVASCKESEYSYEEEYGGKDKIKFGGDYHSVFVIFYVQS